MQTENRKLGIVVAFTMCVMVVGLGILASTSSFVAMPKLSQSQGSNSHPKINRTSKTDALELVSVSAVNGFANVALKNVSSKSINGIQLTINGGDLEIDFLGADRTENQRILPNAIYQPSIPFDGGTPVEIAILAVTFDDGTSSGSPRLADEIFETRRGIKTQLTRFKDLLAEARKSSDVDSPDFLEKLKAQTKDLPGGMDKDSGGMRMGEVQARAQIIQEIDFLKERLIKNPGLTTVRDSVSELEARHERRLEVINQTTKMKQ
jgi:hypothetical protein